MRARRKRSFFNRTVIFSATFLFACSFTCSVARAKERVEGPGFVKELEATPRDVLDALKSDLEDQTIHGTLVFDKEPTLTGATQSDTSRFFAPWTSKGQVFYKVRPQAIAPRHFLDSADEGIIEVRFVLRRSRRTALGCASTRFTWKKRTAFTIHRMARWKPQNLK